MNDAFHIARAALRYFAYKNWDRQVVIDITDSIVSIGGVDAQVCPNGLWQIVTSYDNSCTVHSVKNAGVALARKVME